MYNIQGVNHSKYPTKKFNNFKNIFRYLNIQNNLEIYSETPPGIIF